MSTESSGNPYHSGQQAAGAAPREALPSPPWSPAKILLVNFLIMFAGTIFSHFGVAGPAFLIGPENPNLQNLVIFAALAPLLVDLGLIVANVVLFFKNRAQNLNEPAYLVSAFVVLLVGSPVCFGSALTGMAVFSSFAQ